MSIDTKTFTKLAGAFLIGTGMLWFPLLGDFHIESAMLASAVGCIWGAVAACEKNRRLKHDFYAALRISGWIYLAGMPLLLISLVSGCFSIHGLGFWLLFPMPGIFLGYSIGRLLRNWDVPYRKSISLLVIMGIAVGVFLVEFFSFPQVYFFNHIWGGWPGPIYDETVLLTGSFVYFRLITLFWILLLWFIPSISGDSISKWIVILSVIALAIGYTQMTEMGIVSPGNWIEAKLGGSTETNHFKLIFDNDHFNDEEIDRIGLEHEFYLNRITGILDLAKPRPNEKIVSYIYAHPWQKKKITGAKFTSYVPVWLEEDQLHIAAQQLENSLEHEMVHVLAKQFGNRFFNASWSIGLIEGLAVAVSGGDSGRSTIDQLVAAEKPYPGENEMKRALSPFGFYGGRSAVNYTTSGSFVKFLLDRYEIEHFKEAYKNGDLVLSYPVPFDSLIGQWHRELERVSIDSVDRKTAHRIFGIPSLFEKDCPHVVGLHSQIRDWYRFALADRDTARALGYLDRLMELRPESEEAKAEWTYRHLLQGNVEKVVHSIEKGDLSTELQLLQADAFRMSGQYGKAGRKLNNAIANLSGDQDSTYDEAIATRLDSLQWSHYLDLTYHNRLFGSSEYMGLYYRTKMKAVEIAIEKSEWGTLQTYSQILINQPVDSGYFSTYEKMIHYLAYTGNLALAEDWIKKLKKTDLRARHREKLNKEIEWIQFLRTGTGS